MVKIICQLPTQKEFVSNFINVFVNQAFTFCKNPKFQFNNHQKPQTREFLVNRDKEILLIQTSFAHKQFFEKDFRILKL